MRYEVQRQDENGAWHPMAAHLFLELGFPPEEAERLQQASQQQINDTKQLKLMAERGRGSSSIT